MKRRLFLSLAATSALVALATGAAAQSTVDTRMRRPYRDDLATGEERAALDRSLRNARTDRERERIQSEHRTQMNDRARSDAARGVSPYQAPANGWTNPNAPDPNLGVPGTATPRRRASTR